MRRVEKSNPEEGHELKTDYKQAQTADLPPASENPLKFVSNPTVGSAVVENLVFQWIFILYVASTEVLTYLTQMQSFGYFLACIV